jgi:hypothetical protein
MSSFFMAVWTIGDAYESVRVVLWPLFPMAYRFLYGTLSLGQSVDMEVWNSNGRVSKPS